MENDKKLSEIINRFCNNFNPLLEEFVSMLKRIEIQLENKVDKDK